MNIIHYEEEAFFKMQDELFERLSKKFNAPVDRWIDGAEVMRMLRVKSPTTLQKLRDEGHITYSQPSKKIILYDRLSVEEYITKHIKNTF